MKHTVFLLALLGACVGRSPPAPAPDGAQTHILRTYKIPDGQDQRVARLLRGLAYPIQVVTAQGAQTQFVHVNPQLIGDGYLSLAAPQGIHDGVRELLDQLQSVKAPPPAQTVDTTFWLVLGWPSKEKAVAPDLGEAAAAIEALGGLGPMRYELLDRVQVRSIDGEDAVAFGNAVDRLTETPVVDGDSVALKLSIRVHGGQGPSTGIETSVNVKSGQLAILGQAGFVPTGGSSEARASLFYVVRARILP